MIRLEHKHISSKSVSDQGNGEEISNISAFQSAVIFFTLVCFSFDFCETESWKNLNT